MTITERRESLDGIAVIGMAGRFPGARTIAEFWRNLLAGVESISRFAPHELEPSPSENPAVRADPRYVPARGIVDDVELVAVCQAAQSLLSYQCDMALAGGVSIALPQRRGYLCHDGAITSPDGHCRAFDAEAQGTVFGNGLGVVVLKRLADAYADGDHVCAVIKGTGLNNDGSGKVSFLAPSVDGHAEVVAMAQAFAGIEPRTISFVEAHGTGTTLGDAVELAALTQAFRSQTSDSGFCALGSVKT